MAKLAIVRNQLRREYTDKLKWLKTRRFGSPELNSECVFNRSSLELTPAQLEVLSRGPRFGIPPVSVCKEEIHAEFELFFQQIDRALSFSSLPKEVCTERMNTFKTDLTRLANDYCSIKQDKASFSLGR